MYANNHWSILHQCCPLRMTSQTNQKLENSNGVLYIYHMGENFLGYKMPKWSILPQNGAHMATLCITCHFRARIYALLRIIMNFKTKMRFITHVDIEENSLCRHVKKMQIITIMYLQSCFFFFTEYIFLVQFSMRHLILEL